MLWYADVNKNCMESSRASIGKYLFEIIRVRRIEDRSAVNSWKIIFLKCWSFVVILFVAEKWHLTEETLQHYKSDIHRFDSQFFVRYIKIIRVIKVS